jgi:hypothetical protein
MWPNLQTHQIDNAVLQADSCIQEMVSLGFSYVLSRIIFSPITNALCCIATHEALFSVVQQLYYRLFGFEYKRLTKEFMQLGSKQPAETSDSSNASSCSARKISEWPCEALGWLCDWAAMDRSLK